MYFGNAYGVSPFGTSGGNGLTGASPLAGLALGLGIGMMLGQMSQSHSMDGASLSPDACQEDPEGQQMPPQQMMLLGLLLGMMLQQGQGGNPMSSMLMGSLLRNLLGGQGQFGGGSPGGGGLPGSVPGGWNGNPGGWGGNQGSWGPSGGYSGNSPYNPGRPYGGSNSGTVANPPPGGAASRVIPLSQSLPTDCGATAAAMAVNAVTGQHMTDLQFRAQPGYGGGNLLHVMNAQSQPAGYSWRDAGHIGPSQWGLIDQKVNQEGTPVVAALNGEPFSHTGRGHFVTIIKTDGNKVYYADPNGGKIKVTTKDVMDNAPEANPAYNSIGNHIYVADKLQ